MEHCKNCGQIKGRSTAHACPNKVWNKGTKGVMRAWNKGLPRSPEHRLNISKSLKGRSVWNKGKKTGNYGNGFKKGANPWNKGMKGLQKAWNKDTKGIMKSNDTSFKKGELRITGDNNPQWKGDNASYFALHIWIKQHYGKANHCSFDPSHQSTHLEWANISGSYLRDVDDYAQLCVKCHRQYDAIRWGYGTSGHIEKGDINIWQ